MLSKNVFVPRIYSGRRRRNVRTAILVIALLAFATTIALALPQNTQSQTSPQQTTTPQQQKPASPGEAGGPGGDLGPIAIPKKPADNTPPPPSARKPQQQKLPEYTITTDVPLVNVDVLVNTKDGQFVPNLKKDNFRVYEDGVEQKITNFTQQEAPITAVMLVEFAATNYQFMYDALNASYNFANTLKKDDWAALIAFDMRPEILVDFTQDKRSIYAGLNRLRIPGFSETCVFDALYDTLDRVDGIEGRKYIILIATGYDSFSKITYDTILKKVKATPNTVIYAVGIGQALIQYMDSIGAMGSIRRLDFLQAQNELNTFAKLTGGKAYFPRFEGELPEIFADIGNSIRNEYAIAYHPTNPKLDGSYRKLKVELLAPDGKPLKMIDQKGKEVKYQVIAREGYTAKHVVD
jgi:VWFA-related protein